MAARRVEAKRTGPPVSPTHSLLVLHMVNLPKTPPTSPLTALKAEEAVNGVRAALRTLNGAPTTRLAPTGVLKTIRTVIAGVKIMARTIMPGRRTILEVNGVLQEPTVSRASPPTHPIILQTPNPPLMLVMANKLTLVQTMEAFGARTIAMVGEPQREVHRMVRRRARLQRSSSQDGALRVTKNRTFGEARQARNLPRRNTHHLKATWMAVGQTRAPGTPMEKPRCQEVGIKDLVVLAPTRKVSAPSAGRQERVPRPTAIGRRFIPH